MPIHMCWNLRFFSSDKLKTPKKNCFLPALNSQIFTNIRALLWRKIVILEFMMNQFHFFSSKKDARISHSGTDSTKIVSALCKKLEIVFGLDFIWKRIEQIQIVQPECDGIWKLILLSTYINFSKNIAQNFSIQYYIQSSLG